MSKIKEILSIQLEKDIKNVIDLNSQEEKDIKDELNGFILTESLAKHLSDFLDVFCSDMKESGVWLSGFYGSGKSYFAKMLGFLIANPIIQGTSMRERFLPKLEGLKNKDIIVNQILSLERIQYQVTLFDSAKVDASHGISYMAMSHFLLSLGFLSNWIGMMEYNLMLENKYEDFLKIIKDQNEGKEWKEVRKNLNSLTKIFRTAIVPNFMSEDDYKETRKLVEDRINTYDAVKLREDLSLYLEHFPQKKLVFFIDEVSEALSQKKINLLDLEGVSEALSSLGNRVWTIGIAQQAFNDVLNASGLNIHQLNKVEARFKTRIPIAAEEIDTIIRKRLLAKTDEGKKQLENYYAKNSGMIQDITNIAGVALKATKDEDTYADYYPFYEHQFKLLQYFLFGSRDTVTSQIGTRGMLVSVFDVLKKEALTEDDVYTHVNATQLCKQAEESIPEALRLRYEQADNHLSKENFKEVDGKALMQAIHFLEKAEAQTTAENITRSYVRRPEDYYGVLAEIKKALEILVEHNILMLNNNQYRITSQVEQQIIDEMNAFTVESYRAIAEVTKVLKSQRMVKSCQNVIIDGQNIAYCVETSLGENFANQNVKYLKMCFYDVFFDGDESQKIAAVKQDTQSEKGCISIIPTNRYSNEIMERAKELLRMDYIDNKAFQTAEEKKVVTTILSAKEDKTKELNELVRKSYVEGTLVYLFNVYQLNETNCLKEMEHIQIKMYNNIFTQRLSASLLDSVAPKLLTANPNQLVHLLGNAEEFRMFDTTGKFIGENLSVVTAILANCKSFTTGADLESKLTAPPTGYNFGTIITTLAALYRANKVIAKYNGEDYHSVADAATAKIFENGRNFGKTSFKAVLKSLSYTERQKIVDILKEDCEYKKNTGEPTPSYNLNDFEVVDCIRTLSKRMASKVNDRIMGSEQLESLFKRSVEARNIFTEFTMTVTESNYIGTAKQFLQEAGDYISAVEQVQKDLRFLDSEFKIIEEERLFISDVEEEVEKAGSDTGLITPKKDKFLQAREADLVSNAPMMKQLTQDVKDIYFQLLDHEGKRLTEAVVDMFNQLESLKEKISQYDDSWNTSLSNRIEDVEHRWKPFLKLHFNLNGWSVKCASTHLTLRDIAFRLQSIESEKQHVALWEFDIVTEAPVVTPPQAPQQPTPTSVTPVPPAKPTPKTHAMGKKMPHGSCTVHEYRSWLKQQLMLLNKMGDTDILDFDN